MIIEDVEISNNIEEIEQEEITEDLEEIELTKEDQIIDELPNTSDTIISRELLFGWITKPQIELSFLDNIIAFLEIIIFCFLIAVIIVTAVCHGKTYTTVSENFCRNGQTHSAIRCNIIPVRKQHHIFDFNAIGSSQIHASNGVLIVCKNDNKIFYI